MSYYTFTKRALAVAFTATVFPLSAFAADSFSLEGGVSEHHSQIVRGAVQWNWDKPLLNIGNNYQIGGYWDASLALWRGTKYKNVDGDKQHFVDIGFTPVFRFQSNSRKGLYAEAGVGVHLFSQLYNNDGRTLSTAFQFGDHIGAGYVMQNGLDLSLRYQHFSNGSIKQPNSGIEFFILRAAYPF